MSGETDIAKLLDGLNPVLDEKAYAFASLPTADAFVGLAPIMMFNEAEGVTGIVPLEKAKASGVAFEFPSRRITLQIHSSFEAVGLIAKVSEALEDEDIPANVVSAFYHDHVFVPEDKAELAMETLLKLSSQE